MAQRHGYGENSNVYAKYATQSLDEFAPGGSAGDELESMLKSAGLPIRAIHEAAPRSNQIWTGNKPAATLPTTTAAAAAPKQPWLPTPNKSKEAAYAAANKAKAAAPAPAAAVPVAEPVAAPAAPVAAKEPTPDSPTARYSGKTGELTAYGAELAAKEKVDIQAAQAAANKAKAAPAAPVAASAAPAAPSSDAIPTSAEQDAADARVAASGASPAEVAKQRAAREQTIAARTSRTAPTVKTADPSVDPRINPIANPRINPIANPRINPIANPATNPEAAAIAAMKAKNPKLAAMMAQAGLDDQGNDIAAAQLQRQRAAEIKESQAGDALLARIKSLALLR
jgi:hypothetical protein